VRIGVPRESKPGERRVAATPKTVEQLKKLGYDVAIEAGAGSAASFEDDVYRAAGAEVVSADEAWAADIIFKINPPNADEVQRLREGQILVGVLAPALDPDLVQALSARGVTALAMDAVPRISRAQSLDVLSSMANIGGYRAVIEAANEFGSFFTGSGHRGRQGPAREGARRGGRRRRPGGHRHSHQSRAPSCAASTPARRSPNRSSRWAPSS
jgi:NAD(P) transhydrogenase subunit alpha